MIKILIILGCMKICNVLLWNFALIRKYSPPFYIAQLGIDNCVLPFAIGTASTWTDLRLLCDYNPIQGSSPYFLPIPAYPGNLQDEPWSKRRLYDTTAKKFNNLIFAKAVIYTLAFEEKKESRKIFVY